MKLVMDERLKHRLVGLLVIISLSAIFVPGIVKKSNQRFDSVNAQVVSVRLPDKPPVLAVTVPDHKALFKRAQVAHVDISIDKQSVQSVATISKAERLRPLSSDEMRLVNQSISAPVNEPSTYSKVVAIRDMQRDDIEENTIKGTSLPEQSFVSKSKLVAVNLRKVPDAGTFAHPPSTAKAMTKTIAVKSVAKQPLAVKKAVPASVGNYSVQLATFSKKKNAYTLMNQLSKKGYRPQFIEIATPNETIYKVLVGNFVKREEARYLQHQLIKQTALNGFIVPARVG